MAEIFDILEYEYTKEQDILDIPNTWTPIVTQTVTPADIRARVYEIGFSASGTFPNITEKVQLRYRVNDMDWIELSYEPSDVTDSLAFYYAFPYPWNTADPLTLEVEAQKSGGADPFDIVYADAWMERKK